MPTPDEKVDGEASDQNSALNDENRDEDDRPITMGEAIKVNSGKSKENEEGSHHADADDAQSDDGR